MPVLKVALYECETWQMKTDGKKPPMFKEDFESHVDRTTKEK